MLLINTILHPRNLYKRIKFNLSYWHTIRVIRNSGLFDVEFYLENYPDVKDDGMDPLKHYYYHGWKEGRNPSNSFNTNFYITTYPDVKNAGINPLFHFVRYGKKEKRLTQQSEILVISEIKKVYNVSKYIRSLLVSLEKLIEKIKYSFVLASFVIKRNGSLKITLKKFIKVLRKEGIKGAIIQLKKHSYYAQGSNESTEIATEKEKETKKDNTKYRSPNTILFIGHDAHLAGAQVLLLSLVKWFSEHTGVTIKIILLRNGVLFEKYNSIASTLIWEDICNLYKDKDKRNEFLRGYIGKIDLIYGNTVISPTIYDEFAYLGVPFITHVHELEKSIKLYADKATIIKMKLFTSFFIGCSKPVSENLITNHNVEKEKIATINEFIENRQITFNQTKVVLRKRLGLIEEALIVLVCGTMYWRKGVDLFVETAIYLKKKGKTNFHFYWIGENFWDFDNASKIICSWNELLDKILKNGLNDNISFLGVKENVFDYLQASDIFYLPSREDPFPLVCLEAAQCGVPVICFENAGGISDFIEKDAGFVVPFEDTQEAAEKIIFLDKHRDKLNELGTTARKKFLARHSIDIAAPGVLNLCQKIGNIAPLVSVIVPNYNYRKYLEKRLDSILNQTFKDFEIIILDDASTDGSLDIVAKYLHLPNVRLIKNSLNSGNAFKQWNKGFMEAKGEIIWFAEADDYCQTDFLEKLLPNFINTSVALSYCDSTIVDEKDSVTGNYDLYLEHLDSRHWKSSYQVTGQQEINFGLGVKNSIPNASAVLIRKSCISESIFNGTFQFKFSGDWFFYTQLIKGKLITFNSEKLNYHRKHSQTISSRFNTESSSIQLLLKEAELIHNNILENYSINFDYPKKWEFYITEQILAFYPKAEKFEFDNYYPFTIFEEKIKKAAIKGKNLVFITTNDGSSNGGSEQLWRFSAMECSKRGHNVMVVIKNWNPVPFFIKDLYNAGITVVFKEINHFNTITNFEPDLIIISIGDQDEGIDYYENCQTANIPYIIVNHLSKEPKYWPIRTDIVEQVKQGYLNAKIVLFTGKNNHKVMEKRISCTIPNAGIFYNPFDVDRNTVIPFPSIKEVLKIAIPASLVIIHKGQNLAIELFNLQKWRNRLIHLNIYGRGSDEIELKNQVRDNKMTNVTFHGHSNDILAVWKENHAIFLSSFMEGLPITLVGAMICGRVPIVTDIGAHCEVIDDNINGFIAKEPTVAALDEAFERAYQKLEIWEDIGRKSREKILSIVPEDPIDDFINKIIPLTRNNK